MTNGDEQKSETTSQLQCVSPGLIAISLTLVKIDGGRPTFRFAMRCNQRDCVKSTCCVSPPPSLPRRGGTWKRAGERESGRAHLAVCLCACARACGAATSGNSVIVGKSRSGFRWTDAAEREKEDASLFIPFSQFVASRHPLCESRVRTPQMPCCMRPVASIIQVLKMFNGNRKSLCPFSLCSW